MFIFKNILVPTDFSDQSEISLNYAIELAKSNSAKIHIIHVIEPSVYPADLGFPQVGLVDLDKELVNSSNIELENLDEKVTKEGIECFTLLTHGKPSEEIVNYAYDNNMDLICISTHGRSGFEHLLFGSTTEKVIRKAPCPVLVVRELLNNKE